MFCRLLPACHQSSWLRIAITEAVATQHLLLAAPMHACVAATHSTWSACPLALNGGQFGSRCARASSSSSNQRDKYCQHIESRCKI